MKKIYVDTKEQLDNLFNGSALTSEGLSEESIPDFINWIKERSEMTEETVCIISGKFMNESYELTGTNKYPDDLTIVSVPLDIIKDINALVIDRFSIGARWFDDIVDNNSHREKENKVKYKLTIGKQYLYKVNRKTVSGTKFKGSKAHTKVVTYVGVDGENYLFFTDRDTEIIIHESDLKERIFEMED